MGRPLVQMQGKRFGRLVVLGLDKIQHSAATWLCRCDCGRETSPQGGKLRSGETTSCGCFRADNNAKLRRSHGHGREHRGGTMSPTYRSWSAMKYRCSHDCPEYGARGISVCDRWQSFEAFLADMGERPDGMTLDRIDPNGNYEPGNVRWATRVQQENNKRNNRIFTAFGVTMTLSEWARAVGVKRATLQSRIIQRGLPVEASLGLYVGGI